MRIVVAPDKFKGSLTAPEVASRVAVGARLADPTIEVIEIPVADGGEGTLDAAIAAGYTVRRVTVAGPTGIPITAEFAVRDSTAVVEMALASGLDVLPKDATGNQVKDATGATSLGTGQLIRAALDTGARHIVLGIGGSASTDGGAGLLQGLGARLLDAAGTELPLGGGALAELADVDLTNLDPRLLDTEIVLASDVNNPLLGEHGAAAVFGPQKGASPAEVLQLDQAIANFVDVLATENESLAVPAHQAARRPGAGAAGGVGFAAISVLGAERRPGIEVVLEFTGLADRLAGADVVITGEGSLDTQSLMGKTPIGVARAAQRAGIPVYALCGRTTLTEAEWGNAGFAGVRSLAELEPDPQRSMAAASDLLTKLAEELVTDLVDAGSRAAFDTVIRGDRVLIDGEFRAAEIGIRDGVIISIAARGAGLLGAKEIDLPVEQVLLPGLVDTHVHVNEPGRTEWEGFVSATRAAAAGGVTTIIDMPLNSIPPTVTVAALDAKRKVAAGKVHVDVGFWGGVIPGNNAELAPLIEAGVFGFKCFLAPSGVDEFPEVTAAEMRTAMQIIADEDSLLVVHAENADALAEAPHIGGHEYRNFLESRPGAAEDRAIADVIAAADQTGARAHILHLSNADSLDRIAKAKADGVRITVETCPHYLALEAENIPAGATAFKCCPPIREHENRERLWEGLEQGTIDYIVSDHSPATPEMKFAGDGDFAIAWGGIASLQLGLPIIWTEARRRGIPLERVVGWLSTAPAERVGLRSKGRIAVGAAADFAVFAPEATFQVDATRLEHRHPITPYDGRELTGVVHATYLAGEPITSGLAADRPRGRLLRCGD